MGKKYITKITPKQQKFIDLYTSKYGELSATDCAIKAGYERESAHTRASELLDWRKNPEIVKQIDARQLGNKEVWLLDKTKHLANLTRIQSEARAKGQYGVAAKCEELKGKVQGFYVDRNLTLTKELSDDDIHQKMKDIFKTREEYDAMHESLADELFEKEVKVEEDDKS
jgi:phage terminase small subunit